MKTAEPIRILIVEDNPNDLELMIRVLKQQNLQFDYFVAEDGEEALDFIFNNAVNEAQNGEKTLHIIFLDLKLPKISGLEVLRKIKTTHETRNIPVIVLTSSREDQDIAKAYSNGANAYVVKPVSYKQFEETIKYAGLFWIQVNETP